MKSGRGRTGRMVALGAVAMVMAASGGIVLALAPPPGADFEYWAPWSIGLAAFLVSGLVWAMRPAELATQLFLIGGLAFMTSLMSIADFSPHMPPRDAETQHAGLLVNLIANQAFNLSLISLFLAYPKPLLPARWTWVVMALILPVSGAILLMDRGLLSAVAPFLQLLLLAVIGLIVWQWIATARAPRERAALTWLALSVIIGAALWVMLILADSARGTAGQSTSGALALVLFFPFYIGLALGVARFCLIELQDWTFRILFFVMAALLFVAIDAALVMAMGLTGNVAAGVALFAVAFLYLPLRDIVWRRFVGGRRLGQPEMFAAVMEIVFAPTPGSRAGLWRKLVRDLFTPLDIADGKAVDEAAITEGGLRLVLPAVAESPALMLSYAREGRGLFTPSQLATARQLVALVRTASQSRDAYERGAAEERHRLAQDLHDDVGARLLSGLNVADDRTRPILHAALGDIRAIANGLAGTAAPLDRVMADLRHECVRRFEAAGLETDWPVWPDTAPLVMLDYRLQKALGSALRESASNIIRHAAASTVEVEARLDGERLSVRMRDDGAGLSADVLSGERGGQGLKGLVRRLGDVGGGARFGNRVDISTGAQVDLDLPLRIVQP